MLPPKMHVLFCFCSCLALAQPFDWQDPKPVAHMKSSAWVSKIQALMAAAGFGQTKIPRGNGSYSVGCTDLMFDYTQKGTFLRLYYPSQDGDPSDTLWIPDKEYFWGLSKFLGTHWLLGKILSLFFGSMTTPAAWNSPLRTGEKYPLIIFSHGLGAFRSCIVKSRRHAHLPPFCSFMAISYGICLEEKVVQNEDVEGVPNGAADELMVL